MEHLTKHQIVLVALLVAFVTSVTTGIVTVSLVDQNAPTVPQVVDRVVERTIEKVVPTDQKAAVVTKETIIVRSEDQTIAAINKNSGSLVRIYSVAPPANTADTFLGLGVVVSREGKLIADRAIVSPQGKYYAAASGGKFYEIEPKKLFDSGIALFALSASNPAKAEFTPVVLSKTDVRLGQNVLSLGGRANLNVTTGIVSEMVALENPATSTSFIIKTDIDRHSVLSGSPLVNLTGELVGLNVSKLGTSDETSSLYLPSTAIAALLAKEI